MFVHRVKASLSLILSPLGFSTHLVASVIAQNLSLFPPARKMSIGVLFA